MKCMECGKNIELTEKTYEVNKNQAHIRIENVPAYVCECGEVYYSDEVFERIESMIRYNIFRKIRKEQKI